MLITSFIVLRFCIIYSHYLSPLILINFCPTSLGALSDSFQFSLTLLHSLWLSFILCASYSFSAPLIHSLRLLFIFCASYSFSAPLIHSLCLLFILCASYSFSAPLIHSLCLLFILWASLSFSVPLFHSLWLFNRPLTTIIIWKKFSLYFLSKKLSYMLS